MFRKFDQAIAVLGELPGYIIALIALGIGVDVVMRNAGFGSIPWMLEAVEYALFALTFTGTAYVLRRERHVRVEVFVELLPVSLRRIVEVSALLVVLVVTTALLVFSIRAVQVAHQDAAVIRQHFDVAEWIPLCVLPASFLLLLGEVLRRL